MIKLYFKLENLWFLYLPQKLRFLLVGGFNTVCAYLLFLFFLWTSNYQVAVILSYFIAINISIFTMRHYVFRAHGNLLKQYAKAALTYLVMIPANYAVLWVFCDYLSYDERWIQAWFSILAAIISFCLHKYVNFRN